MQLIFKNPFLNKSNKNLFKIKIGEFYYEVSLSETKSTKIDFDERKIEINNSLDAHSSLRELIRAFFIIITYELNLNEEFPNGSKANLDNIAFAHLSWLFMSWFNKETYSWDEKSSIPLFFIIGNILYSVEDMVDVSYQSTRGVQYGFSDHTLGIVKIIKIDRGKEIPSYIREQVFWHEYVHSLFVRANEDYANDIEYVVDAFATQIMIFMEQLKIREE